MEIENVELAVVKELIPNNIYSILIKNGFETIGQVRALSEEQFGKLGSIGLGKMKKFQDLLSLIKEKPQLIYAEYINSLPLTIPQVEAAGELDFLQAFEILLNQYYQRRIDKAGSDKKKAVEAKRKEVISYAFALKGGKALNDEEISRIFQESAFNITLGRNNEISELALFFTEGVNTSLNCVLSESFKSQLIKWREILSEKIYSEEKIREICLLSFNMQPDSIHDGLLTLFLNVMGFYKWNTPKALLTGPYHYLRMENSRDVFKRKFYDLSEKLFKYLRKTVLPVDLEEIFIHLNITEPELHKQVEAICDNWKFCEKIELDGKFKYQLQFARLSSSKDKAYRILWENKAPMHVDDIVFRINRTLVGDDKSVKASSLSSQMAGLKLIVPIAKTGVWALKEWNVNTQTTKDLLLESFRYANKELSPEEIHEIVQNEFHRLDISLKSVNDYLSGTDFYKLDDSTCWISMEMTHQFQGKYTVNRRKELDKDNMLRVFELNQNKGFNELFDAMRANGIDLHENSLRKFLKNPWVNCSDTFPVCYSLVENYMDFMDPEFEHYGKRKKKVKFVLELLELMDGRIPMNDLVKRISHKFKCPSASVYKLINEMEMDFKIEKETEGTKKFVKHRKGSRKLVTV